MKQKTNALALLVLSAVSMASTASTTLSLDTGFNHATGGYFSVGSTDAFWQVISKYPLLAPLPVSPANVVPSNGWLSSSTTGQSLWVSGYANGTSPATTGPYDPGYTIYRKCFCVMPEALVQTAAQGSGPIMNAKLRADDNVQVWLNNQLAGQLLSPVVQAGRWSWSTPIDVIATASRFRPYINCVYVLVEDDRGGRTGFSMTGSVSSKLGLWDQAGSTDPNSYKPCPCKDPNTKTAPGARLMSDEQEDIQGIVKYAEERRITRQKAGKPTAPSDAPPRSTSAPGSLLKQ